MGRALFLKAFGGRPFERLQARQKSLYARPSNRSVSAPFSLQPHQTITVVARGRSNLVLVCVTLVALVPLLVLGSSQFIHYDGYWNLFIATQDRWSLFAAEWRASAHPPLYFLVLRFIAKLAKARLVYRLPSIVPGALGVYMLGKIGTQLFSNSWIAVIGALAYGLSITTIDLFCDVRDYPLALLFALAAFWSFIRIMRQPANPVKGRLLLAFSVLITLGTLTEYYVAFLLVACVASVCFRDIQSSEARRELTKFARTHVNTIAVALALPCCAVAWLYFATLRYHPGVENNVAGFYWNKQKPIWRFLWSSWQTDLSYLFPFGPYPRALAANAAALFLALAIYMAMFRRGRTGQSNLRSIPAQILLFLLAVLAILSVTRRYPFSGYERQQSILFPFVILTAFSFLDAALERTASPRLRAVLVVSVLVIITANFTYGWRHFPRNSQELFTGIYEAFETRLPAANAVYVDQFSLIAYYIHTHDWDWTFKKHLRSPERINVYDTVSPSGERVLLVRNLEWNFDVQQPEFYHTLHTAMNAANVSSADLFLLKQFPVQSDQAMLQKRKDAIYVLAKQDGLTAEIRLYTPSEAFIHFALAIRK